MNAYFSHLIIYSPYYLFGKYSILSDAHPGIKIFLIVWIFGRCAVKIKLHSHLNNVVVGFKGKL